MEWISAQLPIQRLPSISHQPRNPQENAHALHCLFLVSEPTILYLLLMSACHNLRSCSPLKTVLNRLGDTYQAYCNSYKTHAIVIHHRCTGQPLDTDDNPARNDTAIDNANDFENIEHVHPARLAAITRDLCAMAQSLIA